MPWKDAFHFLDYRVVEFACRLPPNCRLRGLQEKFILRKVATSLMPPELAHRPKQPYRAPISQCFLGSAPQDYVSDMLSAQAIRQSGYFNAAKVTRLVEKCHKRAGALSSERENMALVGILSTQLLDDMFVRHFPTSPAPALKEVKIYGQVPR
jgi:asparagine synthase (glutamine-hydrolysing)